MVVLLVALCTALAPSTGGAQTPTVTGSLTINGATVPLTHVYASSRPGLLDKNSEDIRVLFVTRALADGDDADPVELLRLVRDGEARGVEVILSATGDPLSGAVFAPEFGGVLSVSGVHQFEAVTLERRLLRGRLFMNGSRTIADITYHYDVTFSAPVARPPTPDEVTAGLLSPAGRAATAYVDTIRGRADVPGDSQVVSVVQSGPSKAQATVQGTRKGIIIEWVVELTWDGAAWRVMQ